jgi:hypothetical protein
MEHGVAVIMPRWRMDNAKGLTLQMEKFKA